MTYAYITIPAAFVTRKNTLRERIRTQMALSLSIWAPMAWSIGPVRHERGAWEVCVGIGGRRPGALEWLEGDFAADLRAMQV